MEKTVLFILTWAILSCLVPVQAAQFLFFERTLTFNGDNIKNADWDFQSNLGADPGIEKNWVTPVNYYQGSYYLQFQVVSMKPVSNDMTFSIGWMPGDKGEGIKHNHTWESKGKFRVPGTYKHSAGLTGMWYGVASGTKYTYSDWDWTNAYSSLYCYICPQGQNPFPVKVRVKFYIISKGASYIPNPNVVAAPALSPAGGTFDGPTYVWVTTATPEAELRRSYDNTEPSRTSTLVTGPVKISTNKVLNVRAYKEKFEGSSLVSRTFTITRTDKTAPGIVSVTTVDDTTIQVLYSEYVSAFAKVAGNYTINNNITIKQAELLTKDMKTVELTTSPLGSNNYSLTVNKVSDLSGNVIPPNTIKTFSHATGMWPSLPITSYFHPASVKISNPFDQVLNISGINQPYSVRLYDQIGNVYSSVSGLPAGWYLAEIITDQHHFALPVVKTGK